MCTHCARANRLYATYRMSDRHCRFSSLDNIENLCHCKSQYVHRYIIYSIYSKSQSESYAICIKPFKVELRLLNHLEH